MMVSSGLLKNTPAGLTATEVKKGGSLPTYLLYQWVIDVISIIRVGETTRLVYLTTSISLPPESFLALCIK